MSAFDVIRIPGGFPRSTPHEPAAPKPKALVAYEGWLERTIGLTPDVRESTHHMLQIKHAWLAGYLAGSRKYDADHNSNPGA